MKKQNREVGTITKQALNRDVDAYSKRGVSISMWNEQKDAEISIGGFKRHNNGIGGKQKMNELEETNNFTKIRDKCIDTLVKRGYTRYTNVDALKELLRKEGYVDICIWCGKKLKGRNTTTCQPACWQQFYTHFYHSGVRQRLIHERGRNCESCNVKYNNLWHIELHHKIPLCDGGAPWDDDNLILLCPACHLQAHRDYRFEKKLQRLKTPPLTNFFQKEMKIK